jgi:hypothetical protein
MDTDMDMAMVEIRLVSITSSKGGEGQTGGAKPGVTDGKVGRGFAHTKLHMFHLPCQHFLSASRQRHGGFMNALPGHQPPTEPVVTPPLPGRLTNPVLPASAALSLPP